MTFKKGGRRGRLSGYARSNDVLLSYKLLDDGGVYHNNDKTPKVNPTIKGTFILSIAILRHIFFVLTV